jgi:hypothetical protein
MKSNDNRFEATNIKLPFPPTDMKAEFEMEVYARFMRHLRVVPSSRPEICILTATQYVADMMDIEDSLVANTLVDLGLRAPRLGFPDAYLEFIDNIMMRDIHEIGFISPALKELRDHWQATGEDKFAAFKRCYPTLATGIFTPAH